MKIIKLFFLLSLISFNIAAQNKKIALVIGNSDYNFTKVSFAVNNAKDIASKLTEVGFDVVSHYNVDQNTLKEAIDEFGKRLYSYDVGLLYYSGVASQANGDNYIIPIDAEPKTENDVEYSCVNVGRILGKMEDANTKTKLLIFDASTDNEFERTWNFKFGVRGRGLAFMDAPVGSLIAYSTLPGKIMSNMEGKNSVYTQTLLKHIDEPNISIEDMFKKVRVSVKENTQNSQIPWESTSLEGDFYFKIDDNFDKIIIKGIEVSSKETNIASREIKNTFLDLRDGQEYSWVEIGNQVWMSQNLNYKVEEHSWCYENIERNCKTYGRLYDLQGALQACPDEWHLPSDEEWKMLEVHIGMSRTQADMRAIERGTIQGGKLKANSDLWDIPNNGATDELNFSALPGGYRDDAGVFDAMSKWAFFWSSTKQTDMCAWSRVLLNDMTIIERMNIISSIGQNVRCIKDEND